MKKKEGKELSYSILPSVGNGGDRDDTGSDYSTKRVSSMSYWAVCGTPSRLERCRNVKRHDYPQ